MNSVRILIPLRDGHLLNTEVLKAIVAQTVPCELVCVSRPRNGDKRASEAESRNVLREYSSEPYVIMMDSDIVLHETAVKEMLGAIQDSDCDVLAFNTKYNYDHKRALKDGHVPIACAIWKTEKLRGFYFRPHKNCLCWQVNEAMNIGFVNKKVIKAI